MIDGRADQRGSSAGIDAFVWESIIFCMVDCASFGVRAAIANKGSAKVTNVDSGAMVDKR